MASGSTLGPWLLLGPFYEGVSDTVQGLTMFERQGSTVGGPLLAEAVTGADALMLSAPHEGDPGSFRGQQSRWDLVRRPERLLAWGQYNVTNHLAAAFLSTVVIPQAPGPRRWRLTTRISSRVIVAVAGQICLDTAEAPGRRTARGTEHEFSAVLDGEESAVTIAMFRIGRMAQVGCQLEILDGDAQVRIPVSDHAPLEVRAGVERELAGVSLERDLFYPDDEVRLLLGIAPGTAATLTVRLESASTGRTVSEVEADAPGVLPLGRAADLPDGAYTIRCTWSLEGQHVTSTSFQIQKVSPVLAPPGHERREERAAALLNFIADADDETTVFREALWTQVARYAAGRIDEIDEGVLVDTCEFIAGRQDCSDFSLQGLLRLMYWEREQQRLSSHLNAMMKDTVLGFKYWVDEPGDTVMFMASENHRLLFHVAEWMAGQLFPTEEFTNTGQRGLFHAARGRAYIAEWLRQRGRFGFDEWHSNAYFPVVLAPLANVFDFAIAEEYKLREMAGAVLDYMAFILAADTYQGIFGTTHGRSYGRYLTHPEFETTAAVCWLWYSTGSLVRGTRELMGPVALASGGYRPPEMMTDIATDTTAVVESRQRQGLLSGTQQSASFCVYRTPDYLISGLQDHRKGEYESSTHVAQVTLGNRVVIFWSCPLTSGEGSGHRPDYWSGHATLPRVIQVKNVMSLTWQPSELAWMTHCFFEQHLFDEVAFEGAWAFARSDNGYVAIHSQRGMTVGDRGQYAGRELIAPASENTWLVECGREADWGSFAAFVEAVSSAGIEVDGGVLAYQSPSVGRFVTGWEVDPTVDGVPVELDDYPMVSSPWAYSTFGSGELAIRYGNRTQQIWFNQ